MKLFRIINLIFFFSVFLISEAYAADYGATTTADTYKITVTRIELCASGSTKSTCSDSAVIFNGDSGAIDIASTTAGAAAASLGNLNKAAIGTTYTWNICPSSTDCYDFMIFDSYGDGICCAWGNGSYSVTYNGSVVASGGSFTFSETTSSIGSCITSVVGCMNSNATNYDPLATSSIAFGGISSNAVGTGSYYSGNRHLIFDSYVESNIVSAVVYAQSSNTITFELRDNNSTVIDDTTITVTSGQQRLYFDFDVPVGQGDMGTVGDSWDRYWVRMLEMNESIKILRQAIKDIPDGDVHAALPKKVRPQKGSTYSVYESARGIVGFYLISNGKNIPVRLKMRSPCFCNLSILPEIAEGWMISDVITILGSLDIVLGEIDR